jgi:membrane protein DedA with SNARE-associated domain
MDYILDLIRSYGHWFYAITFVWTFLEGETFVVFAGFAAHQNILRLDLLILIAWAGTFTGDQFYFWVGRTFGPKLMERFPRWKPGVERAMGGLRKHSTWFILTFRFVYLVRNFASFACGLSGISWPKFAFLNFIAAGVWACTFAGFGYLLGEAFEHMLGDIAKGFGLVMLGGFLAVVGTLMFLAHRRQARALAAQADAVAVVVAQPALAEPDRRG